MGFTITKEIAQEIKEYCNYQEYEKDDNYHRVNCKYCVFNKPHKCLLHDEKMGFPSDWDV